MTKVIIDHLGMCTRAFDWYHNQKSLDDLERINGRFRITISSEMVIYVANDK